MTNALTFDVEEHDGALVIRPRNRRLDAALAVAFREELGARLEQGPALVILDLQDVEFVDSSGLGALVALLKRQGRRGELQLCQIAPAVARLFQITRMDRIFTIHADRASALAAHVR